MNPKVEKPARATTSRVDVVKYESHQPEDKRPDKRDLQMAKGGSPSRGRLPRYKRVEETSDAISLSR